MRLSTLHSMCPEQNSEGKWLLKRKRISVFSSSFVKKKSACLSKVQFTFPEEISRKNWFFGTVFNFTRIFRLCTKCFFVPWENILSWLAKPHSECPDENFDGIHFHYKTTLYYFSWDFLRKNPGMLVEKGIYVCRGNPCRKNKHFFWKHFTWKIMDYERKICKKKAQFYWDINKTAIYLRRERMEVEVVMAKNKLFFGFEANSVEVLQNIGQA